MDKDIKEWTTKELAVKCHEAENTEDDVTFLQVMNEVTRRDNEHPTYYKETFMPVYREEFKKGIHSNWNKDGD